MKKNVIGLALSSSLTMIVGAAWVTATNEKEGVILMVLGALGMLTVMIVNEK